MLSGKLEYLCITKAHVSPRRCELFALAEYHVLCTWFQKAYSYASKKILRKLCEYKGVEILEANTCPDHVRTLVSIPPKISVASFVGYLKGKSSLMIFDKHASLKYKYGNRHFGCKGYYVDTVGRNKESIAKYIREQLQEDIVADQLSLKELMDPFTGEPVKKS